MLPSPSQPASAAYQVGTTAPTGGPGKCLQHMLEQRTLIPHRKQLCVVMWCVADHFCLSCIGVQITPLQKQGCQHRVTSESQAEPESGLVPRSLALEVHEATNDASEISHRVGQSHTDCASARWFYVVCVPCLCCWLNWVYANHGDDKSEPD